MIPKASIGANRIRKLNSRNSGSCSPRMISDGPALASRSRRTGIVSNSPAWVPKIRSSRFIAISTRNPMTTIRVIRRNLPRHHQRRRRCIASSARSCSPEPQRLGRGMSQCAATSMSPRKATTAKNVPTSAQISGQSLTVRKVSSSAGLVSTATTVAARLRRFHSRASAACSGRIPWPMVGLVSTSSFSVLRVRRLPYSTRVRHLSGETPRDLSAPCRVAPMPAPPVQKFGRRSVAVSLAALVLLVAFPAGASAALRWRACANEDGFQCAVLRVPLDRTGATPGTIGLRVARESRRVKGGQYFLSLSGGPGQGAVAAAPFVADAMAPALQRRRLVVLDQRGTGDSGVLRCNHLQRSRLLNPFTATLAEQCAGELGPNRQYYTTADTVADLEALRQALGVDKLTLQGTSYGTFVAQQYARTYPTHVDRLVLDSVVGPDGVDAFLTDSWSAVPRILQENCAHSTCRAITA